MAAVALKTVGLTYRKRGKIWTHIVLVLGSFIMIFPFIWMVLTSFKTQGEAIMIPPIFLPSNWDLDSYTEVMRTSSV